MHTDPINFADTWVKAWNAHDIEAVLEHFHEDASFTSPFAKLIAPDSDGRLSGKTAIRAYWSEGLRRIPDLHFTIEDVFAGITHLTILYRNQKGMRVCEVLRFEGDKVIEGHGTYAVNGPA